MRVSIVVIVVMGIIACSNAAKSLYRQCPRGRAIDDLQSKVSVSDCTKLPCKLKKNSKVEIRLKVTPTEDVDKLTNTVYAEMIGIPFPFIGVDGTDACENMFDEEGKNKVGCPLKAGANYLYKRDIDVLELYPNVKTLVHWGLTSKSGDLICFEVPAKIVN